MPFSSHLLEFLEFILVGLTIGIIFDFFRACRRTKNFSTFVVNLQDIIYFFLVLIIVLISIILFLDTEIRLYIFIAILVGIIIYFKILSKIVIKIIVSFIKISKKFAGFLVTPESLLFEIIFKIKNFLAKFIKKCCKKFLYIVSLCRKLFVGKLKKQKRLEKNEKRCRNKKDKKKK